MKIKNMVGYCDNKNLKGLEHIHGGHYVYIRKDNKNGTCDVNVVTSLEDKNANFNFSKLKQVKKGNTYPITKVDSTFSRWSGINKGVIHNVPVNKIEDIGKKKIKRKHNFMISKF